MIQFYYNLHLESVTAKRFMINLTENIKSHFNSLMFYTKIRPHPKSTKSLLIFRMCYTKNNATLLKHEISLFL